MDDIWRFIHNNAGWVPSERFGNGTAGFGDSLSFVLTGIRNIDIM